MWKFVPSEYATNAKRKSMSKPTPFIFKSAREVRIWFLLASNSTSQSLPIVPLWFPAALSSILDTWFFASLCLKPFSIYDNSIKNIGYNIDCWCTKSHRSMAWRHTTCPQANHILNSWTRPRNQANHYATTSNIAEEFNSFKTFNSRSRPIRLRSPEMSALLSLLAFMLLKLRYLTLQNFH